MADTPAAALKPFGDCPPEVLGGIRYLLTDIDDTLTEHGRLHAGTLAALERLAEAGIAVIPVTGGCAGWCDHIARAWPVAAVIGENGAFSFRREGGRLVTAWWDDPRRMRARQRHVLGVARQLLLSHPEAALAQDQDYRLCDVAIDHAQAVGPLGDHQIEAIIDGFQAAGVRARASSIHVNAWQGDFDKAGMALRLLGDPFALTRMQLEHQVMFVGDAPNDAPMFATFRHTVGVANLYRHRQRLGWKPAWITRGSHGRGVEEIAEALLTARGG